MTDKPTHPESPVTPSRPFRRQEDGPGDPPAADGAAVAEQREVLAELVGGLLASEWLRRRRDHSDPDHSPKAATHLSA